MIQTYPEFEVTHPVDYTKCFASCNTSINSASIELHEKAFSHRTKSVENGESMQILNQIAVQVATKDLKSTISVIMLLTDDVNLKTKLQVSINSNVIKLPLLII